MKLKDAVASFTAALSILIGISTVLPQAVPVASAEEIIVISQGEGWRTPRGTYCSLTLVGTEYAYTAQHCNGGDLMVGDPIMSFYGQYRLGTVVATSHPDHFVDAVKIKLEDNVIPEAAFWTGSAYSLRGGEPLYTAAATTQVRRGYLVGAYAYDWPNTPQLDPVMLIAPDITAGGDSGGAVLDSNARVVGIVRGGFKIGGVMYTAFTPIDEINQIG